jgi:chromosome segregation ATPase
LQNEVNQKEEYKTKLEQEKINFERETKELHQNLKNFQEKLNAETEHNLTHIENVKRLEAKISLLENESTKMSNSLKSLQKKLNQKCLVVQIMQESDRLLKQEKERILREKQILSDKFNAKYSVIEKELTEEKKNASNALSSLRQLRQEHAFLKRTTALKQTGLEVDTLNFKKENSSLKNQIKERTDLINHFVKTSVPHLKSFKRNVDEFKSDVNSLNNLTNQAKIQKLEDNVDKKTHEPVKFEYKNIMDLKTLMSTNLINVNLTTNIIEPQSLEKKEIQ